MKQYLFLGDSITDADHLFDPAIWDTAMSLSLPADRNIQTLRL